MSVKSVLTGVSKSVAITGVGKSVITGVSKSVAITGVNKSVILVSVKVVITGVSKNVVITGVSTNVNSVRHVHSTDSEWSQRQMPFA